MLDSSHAYLEEHVLFFGRLSKVSQHGSRHERHRSNTDQLIESGLLATVLNLSVGDALLDVGLEPLRIASVKSQGYDLSTDSSHHQGSLKCHLLLLLELWGHEPRTSTTASSHRQLPWTRRTFFGDLHNRKRCKRLDWHIPRRFPGLVWRIWKICVRRQIVCDHLQRHCQTWAHRNAGDFLPYYR